MCTLLVMSWHQVDGVTFENNSDPATAWGAAPAEGDGGSDLVMRSTGDGQVRNIIFLNRLVIVVICMPPMSCTLLVCFALSA